MLGPEGVTVELDVPEGVCDGVCVQVPDIDAVCVPLWVTVRVPDPVFVGVADTVAREVAVKEGVPGPVLDREGVMLGV